VANPLNWSPVDNGVTKLTNLTGDTTINSIVFDTPVRARHIKFKQHTWNKEPNIRVDLLTIDRKFQTTDVSLFTNIYNYKIIQKID
jgi:hypothetical protein